MAAKAGRQQAVVLEMLGDRPTAKVDAPENVLLLERDPDTGDLQSHKFMS
jgi:hypothetical protein